MNKTTENNSASLLRILSVLAILGNLLFILWILYNGINENFQGTIIEKISYVSLMGLLALNAFLLLRNINRIA